MKKHKSRYIIQFLFLAVSMFVNVLMITEKLGVAHEYCPFSAVCFGLFKLHPAVTDWIFGASVIVSLLIILSAIPFRRVFCGYVCPIGTVQEYMFAFFKFNRKCSSRRVPEKLHKTLTWLKYLILSGIVFLVLNGLHSYYVDKCPVFSLGHITGVTISGIIVLIVIFAGSIFIERLWCRYLCPLAALLNIMQFIAKMLRIPSYKIKRNLKDSFCCRNCPEYCPMGVNYKDKETVESVECIQCRYCQRCCCLSAKDMSKCLHKN